MNIEEGFIDPGIQDVQGVQEFMVESGTALESETVVVEQMDALIFLGSSLAISAGMICGLMLWRLTMLSKNQRNVW